MIDYVSLLKQFKESEDYPDVVSGETLHVLKDFVSFLISEELEYRRPDPLVSHPCPTCGHYVTEQKKRRLQRPEVECPECHNKFRLKQ
jgi:predicted RNA-binding Zn-ribbon protein involved in translation (DUF1610 family)